MADEVDLRDPYTGGHSRRVQELCAKILNRLQIYGPEADVILTSACLHDIGKIGISDTILNKPGRYSPEERQVMQTHARKGAELLGKYTDFSQGVKNILHHHEHWDGQGYPEGLRGFDIPFGARVIAVADSYDAMTSNRPYRPAMTEETARQILRRGAGSQWDPKIVEVLLSSLAEEAASAAPGLPQAAVTETI
jgi:putative nucleotidyltransferase with HDIG domain